VNLVMILELSDKKIESSWFKSFFHSDFLNASIRCSVKYLCGYKLFFDPIFVIDLAPGLADTDSYFCCGS
jgi:hypothetical protein